MSRKSQAILQWYECHARDLPWRIGPRARRHGARPDPYVVWLSEVMLQQTTVTGAIPYFERFVARWASVSDLAAAPQEAVLQAWAGLGYYARARNLHAAAKVIRDQHKGRLPQDMAALKALPGIGPYTSAAIAAIAYDAPVVAVDGNVERIVARLFAIEAPLPKAKAMIAKKAQTLLPPARFGEFTEAMMDLGASICRPRKPACALCPLQKGCAAYETGDPERLPVKIKKGPLPRRAGTAFVAFREDGAILLRRRPDRGLLGGMCEVPTTNWCKRPPSPGADKAPFAARWFWLPEDVHHTFTHFHLALRIKIAHLDRQQAAACLHQLPDHWWSAPQNIDTEALSSLMHKVIACAQSHGLRKKALRQNGSIKT